MKKLYSLFLAFIACASAAIADYNPVSVPVTMPAYGAVVISNGTNTGTTSGVSATAAAPMVALGSPASWQALTTKFTASGCSNSATVGGASAGTYTSGTTGICTVVITINGATGATAPNGWACSASDRTTPANLISQTASSTTTATLAGTTTSGDVISFSCVPY